mmetsp:Transcript_17110/g.20136  ORF Transcript_17110/g.20136 Transcript_17110/m.20136 type:complete len:247 (-) Transcript_17110:323-1063(-)
MMIQVLNKKRSSFGTYSHHHAHAAKNCIELQDQDIRLLETLSETNKQDLDIEINFSKDDLSMIMTKMNIDINPTEAEVGAIFDLADIVLPNGALTMEELDAAMRYWRLLIPHRDEVLSNFKTINFGHEHEEHLTNLKNLFSNLSHTSRLLNSEIERILSRIIIDENTGVVNRESALHNVLIQFIIQTLEIHSENHTILHQDGSPTGKNQPSAIQSPETQMLVPETVPLSREDEVGVNVSSGCCVLS